MLSYPFLFTKSLNENPNSEVSTSINMKTASIVLVMIGVCLAKHPTRFPDFLAPFRNMLGLQRRGNYGDSKSFHPPNDNVGGKAGKHPGREEGFEQNSSPHYLPPILSSRDQRNGYAHAEGRPPFQLDGHHTNHFQSQGKLPPQFQPEPSTPRYYQSQARQYRPPHASQSPKHPKTLFPGFYDSQNPQEPQSSGFTDFTFNPVHFDNGNNFVSDEDRRQRENFQPIHPLKDLSHFDGPGHSSRQHNSGGNSANRPKMVPYSDLKKGKSLNRQRETYFDEVYRQSPSTGYQTGMYQGDHIRVPNVPVRHPAPLPFNSERELPFFGGSRKKNMFYDTNPEPSEKVPYGKPMLMSASSNAPVIFKGKSRKSRTPTFFEASKFQSPKIEEEPIPAASGYGDQKYREGSGDRILYHVAGHAGPYSYRFGYDTGAGYNRMFRHEEKDGNGLVKGKYGFYDKNGKLHVVNYSAHPKGGFQAEREH